MIHFCPNDLDISGRSQYPSPITWLDITNRFQVYKELSIEDSPQHLGEDEAYLQLGDALSCSNQRDVQIASKLFNIWLVASGEDRILTAEEYSRYIFNPWI